MAVKATFLAGATTTTTDTLHQWDYGQQLEIESSELPTIVEVHFACPEMSEAIVRPCTVTNGVATTMIPDQCLEQSSPITAWVFVIDDKEGMTKLTIAIPVEKRTRPSRSDDIPLDMVDRYTELLNEINEAVEGLRTGDITAAKALTATSANTAGYAAQAGNAATADNATRADSASYADEAVHSEVSDEASYATNKGQYDDDYALMEKSANLGQAFTFHNTNGFGTFSTKGYFKVWSITDDEGVGYCCLIPSISGKQSLGKSTHIYANVFTDKLRANELCTVDGTKIMEAGAFSENGYSVTGGDYWALVPKGVYMFRINRESAFASVMMDVGVEACSPYFKLGTLDFYLQATQQSEEYDNQMMVTLFAKDADSFAWPLGSQVAYRPILVY